MNSPDGFDTLTGRAPAPWHDERHELGEGLRWTGRDLLMVDILAGRLLALDPALPGPPRTLVRLDVPLGAVAPVAGRPGSYIAAAGTGIALVEEGGGPPRWLARPEEGAAVPARMNDGCCDPRGRFWAGSMAYDATPDAGSLYRTDPDGTVTRVLDGYTVPNGPAFDAAGTRMYLADSAHGRIDAYTLDDHGDITARAVFARVDHGSPDGMQVDADGYLWVAVWGASRVHRYAPDGTLDRVVGVPAAQPASVCVAGERDPVLFIASARTGLTDPAPHDGAVLALPVTTPAAPVRAFESAL
ncbi:SMP-30/gluconolactonase/LRE family protein [Nocardiopsis ansamitocini]|uniref:Calcium-binding protein n=1 Tax=Nocardiopsis ansamitocini TaxID=1670832 RepID=A0A9W6PA86_9ACTN|nr:SMP-30/gluconolactonase/LRE family protein [Nocardiopsis ansamitocini]GLU49976.1 calcium-binding protein [Nocardiopsis ansamitocini]